MTMKICKHSHWLSLHRQDGEVTFTQSNRATTLLHSLPYFESQKPSLFVLVGNRCKALALRELASANTEKRSTKKRGYGEIHLHIDSSAAFSDRPILFADGDFPLQQNISKTILEQECHELTKRFLPRLRESAPSNLQTAADDVYFQLLSPFTDVFCFFATDLGGLEPIARRIAIWVNGGQPSTLPPATQPQIIIVTEQSTPELPESRVLDRFLRLLALETIVDPSTCFAAIQVLSLVPEGDISPQARHRKLKESLMKASDQVRSARILSRTLFSAQHFASFLNHACSHFAEAVKEPFNFIRTSRIDNPLALDLKDHLTNILRKIKSLAEIKSFAVPLIASSLFLDNYPPDMHLFAPRDVFQVLYKDACHQACREGLLLQDPVNLILPSGFVKMIEDSFSEVFEKLNSRPINIAVDLHRQLLLRLHMDWMALRSDDTCLTCLRRRPQFGLPCGHCACENCVRVFGRRNRHNPWLFEVDSCFFCGLSTSGVVVKVLPPTASVRLLTFDGGGVRGLATLVYLQLLQDRVGLPYPVQENFDVVFGTSIGAIIALGLSVKGWTVKRCTEDIERFAILAFQPRPSLGIPLIDFIVSYLADSRYPADNLEAALRESFGSNRSIIDCSKATETGTRVGLPVTTIRDTSICLFTNYNGVGTRPSDCGRIIVWLDLCGLTMAGYHVLGPREGSGRVPLWEIARCGSAAPFYFKPKHISGLGTFQDGGLRQNNPGNLALQEALAIYPSVDEPSLVVSLGTGSSRLDDVPRMSPTRGLFRDGFIARLIRAFKLSFNSAHGHKFRSRRREGRREQYFRFDIEFDGPEPALDDTTKMQELKAAARSAIQGSKDLDRLARCIVAELFIFEFEHDPLREKGKYMCVGRIFCRLRANHPAFTVLMKQLSNSSAKFLVQGHPMKGSFKDGSWLDEGGNFNMRVSLELANRRSNIDLQLQEGTSEPCSISGSPFTVNSLVAAQQLSACFGTSNHEKRKRLDSTDALSKKRQRVKT